MGDTVYKLRTASLPIRRKQLSKVICGTWSVTPVVQRWGTKLHLICAPQFCFSFQRGYVASCRNYTVKSPNLGQISKYFDPPPVKLRSGIGELSKSERTTIIHAPAGYFIIPTSCSLSKQQLGKCNLCQNGGRTSHFLNLPP